MKLLILGLTLSLGLMAQGTLLIENTANSALDDSEYGADFVAGDTISVTIPGAAANSAVTLLEGQNGVSVTPSPYYWGETDSNGDFSLSGTETAAYVGTHEEQWFVGGTQIGNTQDFAVIPVPTTLSVVSASSTTFPSTCTAGFTYGIYVDIEYNILSPGDTNIATTFVLMIPYEEVTFYGNDGVQENSKSGDIGPDTGYSDSALYAADDGTFHDVPVGTCANGGFSDAGASQTIFIDIGDNSYEVRSQRFVTASSSSGQGSITNDNDVSVSTGGL